MKAKECHRLYSRLTLGDQLFQVIPTDNSLTCSDYLNMAASPQKPIISSFETMSIVERILWRQSFFLLAYKVKFKENFFLLRGNHECGQINRIYGFYDECKRRYSIRIWKEFQDVFNCMPIAALIDDKILCMHGGLSPELVTVA